MKKLGLTIAMAGIMALPTLTSPNGPSMRDISSRRVPLKPHNTSQPVNHKPKPEDQMPQFKRYDQVGVHRVNTHIPLSPPGFWFALRSYLFVREALANKF